MKHIQVILVSLTALMSAVPGYTSIREGIGVPPGYGPLFGGTQIALSAIVLLGIFLFREKVARIRRRRLMWISTVCAATFLISLALYITFLSLCTVRVAGETSSGGEEVFYFPAWPGGNLAKAIDQTSRQEVANRYRRSLPDLLAEQGIRLAMTTVALLVLYVTSFSSLIGAFALLGVRIGTLQSDPVEPEATRPAR